MERKIIGLNKGIHRSPTSGEPGELMECMNLIVRNNEIMNAPVMSDTGVQFPGVESGAGYVLRYIHATSSGKVYILSKDNKLYFMRDGESVLAYMEMSAQEKNEKYLEIVSNVETQVKSLELYIVGLEQTIARLKEASSSISISEAQAKMQTFINSVETLGFSRMLRDYDCLYHTSYLSQWNAASLSAKYYMLAYGDFESKANSIVGELRKPVYTTHLIYQTNLGNYYCYEMQDLSAHVPGQIFSKVSKKTITSGGSTWDEYECVYGENGNLVTTMEDGEEVEDFSSGYIHKDYIYYDYDGYKNFTNLYNQIDCDAYYDYYVALNADPTTIANKEAELTTKQQQLATLKSGEYAQKLAEYQQAISANHTAICDCSGLREITGMGNVLIILTETSRLFALYENSQYSLLGEHLPEVDLQFKLVCKTEDIFQESAAAFYSDANVYRVSTEDANKGLFLVQHKDYDESAVELFKTQMLGEMDKNISESKNKGEFIAPFQVRYAYKLYDNTYYMASAPVLMIPHSGIVPTPYINVDIEVENNIIKNKLGVRCECNGFDLYMKNLDKTLEEQLKRWGDIVKGVTVFVSKQFFRYDSGGKYWGRHYDPGKYKAMLLLAAKHGETTTAFYEDYSYYYRISSENENELKCYEDHVNTKGQWLVPVPQKSPEVFEKEISENSLFYVLADYKINELDVDWKKIKIDEGVLSSIESRETYDNTADYMSHDTFVPKTMYVLNNRLHQANFNRKMFEGYLPSSTHSAIDGARRVKHNYSGTNWGTTTITPISSTDVSLKFFVWIKEQGRYFRVPCENSETIVSCFGTAFYFYYPNNNAVMVEVHRGGSSFYLKMKECEYMNGSYVFAGFQSSLAQKTVSNPYTSVGVNKFFYRNKIYSSNVDNPFVVNLKGMNSVGSGEISKIITTTKALSQGQFGSFPLLAFANDGIWALSQNGEGLFSAVQPLSREVLINSTSPCQTDSNIIFASARGINILNGSDVVCISDVLDGIKDMDDTFIKHSSMSAWEGTAQSEEDSFDDVIKQAQFVFDSSNNLLHLYTNDTNTHYVCDLNSKEWTRMQGGKPTSIIMGYPYTYIQEGNKLYRYRGMSEVTKQSTTKRKGLLLTREVSFDNPVAMKMLHDLRVLRKQQSSTTKVVVWVSDDREHWKQLSSLKHSSWKWYRFALYTEMTDVEGIEGIVCDVEERRTNKLR